MQQRLHAIPSHKQVLATFRFFPSGSFSIIVRDASVFSQVSVSRVVGKVAAASSEKQNDVTKPSSADISETKRKLYSSCMGCSCFGNNVRMRLDLGCQV